MKDRTLDDTIYILFTTRAFATGIPTSLLGTPVVSAFEDGTATPITAGITLGVDHNGIVGLNLLTIVATAANGYNAGSEYSLTITTGTVDSVSVIGESVGEFSLQLSAAYKRIDSIGSSSGGAINFNTEADSVAGAIKGVPFVGVQTSGTFGSTDFNDGTYHVLDDTAGSIDVVYQFDIGGGRNAVEITWIGYLSSSNDTADISVYNGTSWDVVRTISGKNGSTDDTEIVSVFLTHTGAGADLGKVFVRVTVTGGSNPTLNTDQLSVAAVNIGTSVGYAMGAIWIDTTNGVAGTELYVNGTADNPCLTLADARSISNALGLRRFELSPDSLITLTQAYIGYAFSGNAGIDLNNQNIGNSTFADATITGTALGQLNVSFCKCDIGNVTLPPFSMHDCTLTGIITLLAAGNYVIAGAHSGVADLAPPPVIDMGAAILNVNVSMADYSQGIEIRNLNSSGADIFSISGVGQIVYAASSSGTVYQRGNWQVTNTGGVTIVTDDDSALIAGNSTKLDDLQGAGFVTATHSNEAIINTGNADWLTGAGGSAPTVVQIRQEMDTNSAQFAQIVADLLDIKGAGFISANHSNKAIIDTGNLNWITGAGGSAPTVVQIRQEMDTNSAQFAQIISDIATRMAEASINTTAGAVDVVTTNTDMRGTDGANTIAPDNAGIAQILVDIAAQNDITPVEVLTQVNAALDTAISELGVAIPAATPSLRTGLMLMYMTLRNQLKVQTSGVDALEVYDDAGTLITKKLLTDDGNDLTEDKMS